MNCPRAGANEHREVVYFVVVPRDRLHAYDTLAPHSDSVHNMTRTGSLYVCGSGRPYKDPVPMETYLSVGLSDLICRSFWINQQHLRRTSNMEDQIPVYYFNNNSQF